MLTNHRVDIKLRWTLRYYQLGLFQEVHQLTRLLNRLQTFLFLKGIVHCYLYLDSFVWCNQKESSDTSDSTLSFYFMLPTCIEVIVKKSITIFCRKSVQLFSRKSTATASTHHTREHSFEITSGLVRNVQTLMCILNLLNTFWVTPPVRSWRPGLGPGGLGSGYSTAQAPSFCSTKSWCVAVAREK